MEEDPAEFSSGGPPLVSLSLFPPARRRRRLSTCCYNFAPVASCGTMAWLSLQGRTVNAEEASSSKSIGFLGKEEEALAWELFTPIQRFLIVAVIGVAASESRKNRTISQLNKSVELRDELLSSMQQKLDSLCLQMANINVYGNKDDEEEEFLSSMGFVDCGCWHCDQHQQELFGGGTMGLMKGAKACGGDEAMELKRQLSKQDEQEERRMSDLSDWASSSASGSEFQISNFMVDQDTCNLKRICEEKDVTIKELTDVLQLTDKAGAKRLSELEDIICRKNAMITRLKKDIVVLEQKVVQLTRVRRKSTSHSTAEFEQSSSFMMDNIVYDMDSLTSSSSSSSDSDSPTTHRIIPPPQTTCQKPAPGRVSSTPPAMARSVSPLMELSMNQKYGRPSPSKSKQLSANGDIKKMRRRRPPPQAASNSIPKKRWS